MTPQEEYRARLNPRGLNITDVIANGGTGIQRNWVKVFQVKEWNNTTCWLVLAASTAGLVAVIWAWRKL